MADSETQTQAQPEAAAATIEPSGFANSLKREFRTRNEEQESRVEAAVRTLAEQALASANLVSSDVVRSVQAIIAALDRKLTDQVNAILHHPDLQKLEGAWRGLHHLVNNT